jgi:hypothetical protein
MLYFIASVYGTSYYIIYSSELISCLWLLRIENVFANQAAMKVHITAGVSYNTYSQFIAIET